MAKRWAIRVVEFSDTDPLKDPLRQSLSGLWLEQLRRLGLINWITQDEIVTVTTQPRADGENVTMEAFKQVFDILAPRVYPDSATKDWAERHAERMQSFQINAVAAPEWRN